MREFYNFVVKLIFKFLQIFASPHSTSPNSSHLILDGTELLSEDVYNELYGFDQTYTVILSDGTEQEVLPNGSEIPVKPSERAEYAKYVRKARMMESEKQVGAVCDWIICSNPF